MTQAIVDAQELRRFAQSLKKFNTELLEQSAAISGQLDHLSGSWRDQEHQKFAEQFTQHLKLIAHFVEANDQHIPLLLRKAQRIEEYLQQR